MKIQMRKWQTVLVAVVLGSTLSAAAQSDRLIIEDPDYRYQDLNRVWGGGRVMFNVKADFSYGVGTNPGDPNEAGVDRTYDNGYVLVDESDNAGGFTWNWGFTEPSAVDEGSETLTLRSTSSPAGGLSKERTDNPQHGFEVGYGRVLYTGDGRSDRPLRVGIDGGFNMTWLDIQDQHSISGTTTTFEDSYDLSGLPIIPSAPYLGGTPTPGGPLPLLLPEAPFDRTTSMGPATATGFAKVDGILYGFQVGPFFEMALSPTVMLQARGGLTAVLADTDFRFTETVSSGGTTSGSTSDDDWLFGGYAELKLIIAVGPQVGIYFSGGFQHVEDQKLSAGGQAVKLDLGAVGTAGVGIIFSF